MRQVRRSNLLNGRPVLLTKNPAKPMQLVPLACSFCLLASFACASHSTPNESETSSSGDPSASSGSSSCIEWTLDPNLEVANLDATQTHEACLTLTRCTAPIDIPREVSCESLGFTMAVTAEPRPATDAELQALCLDNKAECLQVPQPDIDLEELQSKLAMDEAWCTPQLSCGNTLAAAATCAESKYNLEFSCSELTLATPRTLTLAGCELCSE
jgi:hypothetical protein